MAMETDAQPKKSRTRSPAYPYLDLRSALEKAAILWNAEGRHAAAVSVIMQHWGYKEESSTGYSCMAALKKFGLIEHDGIGESKQIRLSSLATAILLDENPASPQRAEALRTAALSPRIHTELWERYGSELPSDQTLKRYLVQDRSFNESVVDELLTGYKQTIGFAGLTLVPTPPSAPPVAFEFSTPQPPLAAGTVVAANAGAGVTGGSAFAPVPAPGRQAVQAAPQTPPAYGDLPPDDWREAGPPARAIGPAGGNGSGNGAANGALRREADAYDQPARRTIPLAGGVNNTNGGRRQPVAGIAGNDDAPADYRRSAENGRSRDRDRELARFEQQEAFGYEEQELLTPPRGNDFQPPGQLPAPGRSASTPVGSYPQPAALTAMPPGQMGSSAGRVAGLELETSGGASRKELPVPLDGDRVALVPYPMTEEDFTLLIATLQLWKKRLVRGGE